MAFLEDFSIHIIPGVTVEDKGTYVILEEDSEFAIKLSNHTTEDADVVLRVNGKEQGTYRVCAKNSLLLETNAEMNPPRKFKAVKTVHSGKRAEDLKEAGVVPYDPANGLILATFKKARAETLVHFGLDPWNWNSRGGMFKSLLSDSYEAAVVTGGLSDQKFETAPSLVYVPESEFCTLAVRLRVIASDQTTDPFYPLLSVGSGKSTLIPVPL